MWNSALSIALLTSLLVTLPESTPTTGTIRGVVRFQDAYPEPEAIRVTQDFDVCGTKKTDETFIVSPTGKSLKNAVIMLIGAKGKPPLPRPSTIRQEGCRYAPHIQVVSPGTELDIINEDGILHNVHAYSETDTLFNLAQPKYLKVIKRTLDNPGVVHIKCDIHDWMEAYIVVTDEPFVVLSDEEGAFRFDGVPPGAYQVRFWHEGIGGTEKPVVVTAGQEVEVNFEIGE